MARVNGITEFYLLPDIAYYSIYWPLKDERLSWPRWLTYSGRLTHICGHPSAAGRAWNRKVRRSKNNVLTTVPRNQPTSCIGFWDIAQKKNRQTDNGGQNPPPSVDCRRRGNQSRTNSVWLDTDIYSLGTEQIIQRKNMSVIITIVLLVTPRCCEWIRPILTII